MQDYRNEIKDFFAVDKQLAAELEYDMKRYEEQLASEKEAELEQVSAVQAEVGGGAVNSVHLLSLMRFVHVTARPCVSVTALNRVLQLCSPSSWCLLTATFRAI